MYPLQARDITWKNSIVAEMLKYSSTDDSVCRSNTHPVLLGKSSGLLESPEQMVNIVLRPSSSSQAFQHWPIPLAHHSQSRCYVANCYLWCWSLLLAVRCLPNSTTIILSIGSPILANIALAHIGGSIRTCNFGWTTRCIAQINRCCA